MKILFYGDSHLRETSSYPLFNRIQENGLTGELNNILLGFDFIEQQIIQHEPDLVVNLGDTYHKDNYVSIRTLYGASIGLGKVFTACNNLNIDHLIIAGNHDIFSIFDDGSRLSSICTLEAYGVIVTENMYYNLGKKNDYRIFMVPHTDNLEEAYQGIMEGRGYDLMAVHLDFLGAVHDNNHPVEHGLDPHIGVPVICGHIHLHQEVFDICHPGSLVQNRFTRECLEDAGGIMIYDTDTGRKVLIQNNLSRHFIKVRDLNVLQGLDPDRCILKIFSDIPEGDVKDLLEGFEYMYITTKSKEEGVNSTYIRHEIDKPEALLRAYIKEDKPEFVDLYDEVMR